MTHSVDLVSDGVRSVIRTAATVELRRDDRSYCLFNPKNSDLQPYLRSGLVVIHHVTAIPCMGVRTHLQLSAVDHSARFPYKLLACEITVSGTSCTVHLAALQPLKSRETKL